MDFSCDMDTYNEIGNERLLLIQNGHFSVQYCVQFGKQLLTAR